MYTMKVGRVYELRFGQDIFVRYQVIQIDFENAAVPLECMEDWYIPCSKSDQQCER